MYNIYCALLLHYGAPLCLFIKIERVCRVEPSFDMVVIILLMLDIKFSAAQRMVFNQLFLLQVQDVTMEIQDLLQWLENTDLRLSTSKTMWGMPDSASERLSAHLVKTDQTFGD